MKAERIEKILGEMGCIKIRGDETDVHSECPLAPWTHEKGRDNNPSFGVLINDNGPSKYNCFSCKTRGNDLKNLVWKWMEFSGKKLPEEMSRWLLGSEQLATVSKKELYDLHPEMRREETLPESWWDEYGGSVPKYILDRGITLDTCRAWGLGNDEKHFRLMFPLRNEKGELVSIIGRKVHGDAPGPKYKNMGGAKKGRYLYGEHMALLDRETVIVVEGPVDALWLWQNGFRDAVAIMGSALSREQARTLVKWNKSVCFFLDGDMAGIQGTLGAIEMLRGRVMTLVMKPLPGKDAAEHTLEELEERHLHVKLAQEWERWAKEYVKKVREEARKRRTM